MEAKEESQMSAVSRVLSPESRASSRSRFTPQSSNGSSANLQHRAQGGLRDKERLQDRTQSDRRELGASLLQERLKEKKAARLSERRKSNDLDVVQDDSVAHISPGRTGGSSRPGTGRDGRPGSSGGRAISKKVMGVKEMEEQNSTLHKQNWDLKLQLFHQRQRQSALEERLEVAEAQIAEQAEMQTVNEQLLAELEKRDQAVEEAVGIICALEEKVERLMQERGVVRSFDAQYELSYSSHSHGKEGESTQDSSNRAGDDASTKPTQVGGTSRVVARMPSFLSEHSEGAEALRSLYLPHDQQSQSLLSLPKLPEDDVNNSRSEADGMNSPRLSVLSESSFLSVYGEKILALEGLDLNDGAEVGSPRHRQHRKSLSVEKWIDERADATTITPPRRPSASKSASLRKDQFPSINNILVSPLQRLEKMHRNLSAVNKRLDSGHQLNETVLTRQRGGGTREKEPPRDSLRKTEMTSFEHQQALPPTPDTISTSTLRMYKNSSDTLGRGASERERSYLDRSNTIPSYNTAIPPRPHSAGETVTSRREGHGWDTVTQSEFTETNSDVDVEAPIASDLWLALGKEKSRQRIQPPDMFTFGDGDDDEWGRDMMFNHDSRMELPLLKRNKHGHGHAPDEEPKSEDTVIAPQRLRRSYSTHNSSQYPIPSPAIGNLPIHNPPERRSSLAISPSAHDKKLRKPAPLASPPISYAVAEKAPNSAASNTHQSQNNTKRYRLTSKLFPFGRSESSSNSSSSGAAPAAKTAAPSNLIRSQSNNDYTHALRRKRNSVDLGIGINALHESSATPPPIARYPRNRDGGRGAGLVRPMTASSLESKLPSRGGYEDGFGIDGAVDEKEDGYGNNKADGKLQGRKWFGRLGRNGSLKR